MMNLYPAFAELVRAFGQDRRDPELERLAEVIEAYGSLSSPGRGMLVHLANELIAEPLTDAQLQRMWNAEEGGAG